MALHYVVDGNKFILFINDKPFLSMPFKANAESAEPMNIEKGEIKLNDVPVHEGWCMWTEDTSGEWYSMSGDLQPTTEIYLKEIKCSSNNMVSTLIDVLGRTINEEQGLRKLTINRWFDQNNLQDWPLEQLLHKSPHLEYLEISDLSTCDAERRSQLLEFAGLAVAGSSCLKTLYLENTCGSAEDGDKLLQVLADSTTNSLERVTIKSEFYMIVGRDVCTAPLLSFLSR